MKNRPVKEKKVELGRQWKTEGWISVDIRGNPDIMHDLNSFPYPFDDNSMDEIMMRHVLEHLDNPLKAVMEMHRILKPGGTATIMVPYGNSTMTNPLHKHDFLPVWFHRFGDFDTDYFNPVVMGGRFRVTTRVLRGRYKPWRKYEITAVMVKVVKDD